VVAAGLDQAVCREATSLPPFIARQPLVRPREFENLRLNPNEGLGEALCRPLLFSSVHPERPVDCGTLHLALGKAKRSVGVLTRDRVAVCMCESRLRRIALCQSRGGQVEVAGPTVDQCPGLPLSDQH